MLGSNVSQVGGYATAFSEATRWSCECIQLHLTPSRTWTVPGMSDEDVAAFKRMKEEARVDVVSHVPFLINLASPDDGILDRSKIRLAQEIQRADMLGVPNIVMHPGSYQRGNKESGLARLVASLDAVLGKFQFMTVKVNLETMAGQGTMLCSHFDDFKYIFEKLVHVENVGTCFDTAHAFMAGHDIRGYEGYVRVMNHFQNLVGIEKIGVIHLNDSLTNLNSHSDRHAPAGEGKMGIQVFHAVMTDERFKNIPMILEIPELEEKTLKTLEFLRKLRSKVNHVHENGLLLKQSSLFD